MRIIIAHNDGTVFTTLNIDSAHIGTELEKVIGIGLAELDLTACDTCGDFVNCATEIDGDSYCDACAGMRAQDAKQAQRDLDADIRAWEGDRGC